MCKTKIVQFRVDEAFFQKILNQTSHRGFKKYSDYLRNLCTQDSLSEEKMHEKLNKILGILEKPDSK